MYVKITGYLSSIKFLDYRLYLPPQQLVQTSVTQDLGRSIHTNTSTHTPDALLPACHSLLHAAQLLAEHESLIEQSLESGHQPKDPSFFHPDVQRYTAGGQQAQARTVTTVPKKLKVIPVYVSNSLQAPGQGVFTSLRSQTPLRS